MVVYSFRLRTLLLWARDNSLNPCNCFAQCYVTGIVLLQIPDHFSSSRRLRASMLPDYSGIFLLFLFVSLFVCVPSSFCYLIYQKEKTFMAYNQDSTLGIMLLYTQLLLFIQFSCLNTMSMLLTEWNNLGFCKPWKDKRLYYFSGQITAMIIVTQRSTYFSVVLVYWAVVPGFGPFLQMKGNLNAIA